MIKYDLLNKLLDKNNDYWHYKDEVTYDMILEEALGDVWKKNEPKPKLKIKPEPKPELHTTTVSEKEEDPGVIVW